MCFYTDSKHPNKKEAKKDIICYKVLFKNWKSIIREFEYKQWQTYSDDNALNIIGWFIDMKMIGRGYYSFSNKKKTLWFYNKIQSKHEHMIVRCIIPKGSYYYYNSQRHEYVSNKIKITDIIKE